MAWNNQNALDRKERVKNKSWFTRVKSWWNNLLNPDHDWLDYDAAPDSLNSKFDNFVRQAKDSLSEFTGTLLNPGTMTSLVNSWTGAGPTGQQIWANETQMQNAEDIFQRQVTGMQKAGLNPALMYQNGASGNAPTVQGQPGTGSMSDIMQAFLLKKQGKLLDAQARNLDTDSQLKAAQESKVGVEIDKLREEIRNVGLSNEQQEIINSWLDKMQRAEYDLKMANVDQLKASSDELRAVINKMDYDNLLTFQKVLESIENINTLKSQQTLNYDRAKYFSKECEYLDQATKNLSLTERDWDYLNVIGNSSFSTKVGPFGSSESRPMTLGELKSAVGKRLAEELDNADKKNKKPKNPMNPSGYEGPVYD